MGDLGLLKDIPPAIWQFKESTGQPMEVEEVLCDFEDPITEAIPKGLL